MSRNKNKNSNLDSADAAPLSAQTLKGIDDAFDRAVAERFRGDQLGQRPLKRRRIVQDAEPVAAGGFLLDDDDAGGGFVLEQDPNNEDEQTSGDERRATHIPLSLIPDALQRLDFDPSDADVLSVFSNAASAWGGNVPSLGRAEEDEDDGDGEQEQEQFVSRADWHAVCAALIPPAFTNDDDESPLTSLDSDSDSISHIGSADLQESESSEDEYIPEPKSKPKSKSKSSKPAQPSANHPSHASTSQTAKTKSKKSRKKKDLDSDSSLDSNSDSGAPPGPGRARARPLTARQKEDTLAAYALFFPSSSKSSRSTLSEDELAQRRLTIKEVAGAAASIKEKITAEEIIEMLSFFSTSSQNNPSLSFQEFQQMMVSSKLA